MLRSLYHLPGLMMDQDSNLFVTSQLKSHMWYQNSFRIPLHRQLIPQQSVAETALPTFSSGVIITHSVCEVFHFKVFLVLIRAFLELVRIGYKNIYSTLSLYPKPIDEQLKRCSTHLWSKGSSSGSILLLQEAKVLWRP